MKIEAIRPSTVAAIKQLAKKLARSQNISHTAAIELASRRAGFENFKDAQRKLGLSSPPPEPLLFPVYLTAHWSDRDAGSGQLRHGRELYRVDLKNPVSKVVPRHALKNVGALRSFRVEYADHIEHQTDTVEQMPTRGILLRAARCAVPAVHGRNGTAADD